MDSYWNHLAQQYDSKETTHSDTNFKNKLAMEWGSMCEDSAMMTYISQYLSKTHPKSKVSETAVYITNDDQGYSWLASSPDGLVKIKTTGSLGVIEIKCPFMGGKPIPYRNVCVYHIPQIMLEMYTTNTRWCHYVVWTPVGYTVHLVKRDDQYITDLLAYLKQFWDSAHNGNCPIPPWQKDALDLKIRAKEICNNCAKLSSGNSVREKRLLDTKSINQFWDIQKDHKSRVATVLENPGKSWNWGKKIPGPGKSLNFGRGP